MFKPLLTTANQIKIQLIENIYDGTVLFLEEASRLTNKSSVLLKKYMDEINHDISFVTLTLNENNQLKLTIAHTHNISHIYLYFLKNAETFKLLECLFYQQYTSYEELGGKLAVSKSTVIRLIDEINQCLLPLDIQIMKRPLRLAGSSLHIQQFFTIYFIEKYQGTDFPNRESMAYGMKDMAIYMNHVFPMQPYFADIQKLSIYLYVMTMRKKLTVESQALKLEPNSKKKEEQQLTEKLSFQEEVDVLLKEHPFTNGVLKEQVVEKMIYVFNRLFKKFDYYPETFDSVLPQIVFEYSIGLNLKVPYYILNHRFERFKKSRTAFFDKYLYTLLKNIIETSSLDNKTLDMIDNLYYMFCIYFPDFREKVIERMTPYQIGLFIDASEAHVEALEHRIKRTLNYPVELTMINPLSSLSYALNSGKFDLLISNLSGVDSWLNIEYQDFLSIDYYVTTDHLFYINQLMDKKVVEYVTKNRQR